MTLRPTLLPAPVAPATITCGMLARSAYIGFPRMSRPSTTGSGDVIDWKRRSSIKSRRTTRTRLSFGSSNPIRFLPGMGATMRTLRASASARSSARPATFETFVPTAGETSYVVTVGPGRMSSTLPCTP